VPFDPGPCRFRVDVDAPHSGEGDDAARSLEPINGRVVQAKLAEAVAIQQSTRRAK
jgi:hypothetical protein